MKNIFKLMGIALMASSMLFVACSDDEEEKVEAAVEGVTVNFNGNTWNASYITCNYTAEEKLIDLQAYKTQNQVPILGLAFNQKEKSYEVEIETEMNTDETGDYYDITGYSKDNVHAIKYQVREDYGTYDWWAQTAKLTVTNFDESAMTVSATVDAYMFDYGAWDQLTTPQNAENIARCEMKVVVKNLKLNR